MVGVDDVDMEYPITNVTPDQCDVVFHGKKRSCICYVDPDAGRKVDPANGRKAEQLIRVNAKFTPDDSHIVFPETMSKGKVTVYARSDGMWTKVLDQAEPTYRVYFSECVDR